MKYDLFNPPIYNEMLIRLNKLNKDSQAEWGKMNVAQMLTHIQRPMELAIGIKTLKQPFFAKLIGPIIKRKVLSDKDFGKNSPTALEFIVNDVRDFELEKKKFLELFAQFYAAGLNGLSKEPHPFFGKMTNEEWLALIWKHLDHHFRQFNV